MHFILHKFRPGETIDAVIKLKGRHDFTPSQIEVARRRFNELNGQIVPRAGQVFKIPTQELVTDDFGNVIDVSTPDPTKPPEI